MAAHFSIDQMLDRDTLVVLEVVMNDYEKFISVLKKRQERYTVKRYGRYITVSTHSGVRADFWSYGVIIGVYS